MSSDRDRRSQRDSETTQDETPSRSLADNIRFGLGIGGGALLVLFLAQNFEDASINLLWFEFTMPLFFALLMAAVLGALATMALGFFRRRAKEAQLKDRAYIEKQKAKK
jgi:uncharacterized integral membrane protein